MRLTVITTVFQDVISKVPFLRDHTDDAPFIIEILSRCTQTRFSAASLLRMQKSQRLFTSSDGGDAPYVSQACLFAAGTFDSELYIINRCASANGFRLALSVPTSPGTQSAGTISYSISQTPCMKVGHGLSQVLRQLNGYALALSHQITSCQGLAGMRVE